MNSTPRKRLLQALGAGGFGQLLNVFVQLVSVPLFLHSWGPELYGEWIILSTIPAYLLMSDVGFVSAAANEMAMRAARGDKEGALAVFQSISWLVITICTVLTAIVIPAAWFLPVETWLGIHHFTHAQVCWSICIFLVQVMTGMLNGIVFFAFRCDGRYPLGTVCADVSRLIEFLAFAAAVAFSRSPVVVVGCWTGARLFTTWGMRRVLRGISPWLYLGVDRVSRAEVRNLAAPAVAFLGFPLGTALTMQGMVLVIGRMLGAVSVVKFTTVRTLCNVIQQMLGLLNAVVGPEMSLAIGAGKVELARRLHRVACQASAWLGVGGACGLAVFGLPLLRAWTGHRIDVDVTLFYLMLLVMVSRSFWFTSSVVAMATNRHRGIAFWFCAGSVASIAVSAAAIYAVGLRGAPIGLLITEVVMNAVVVRHSLKLVDDHYGPFVRAILRPVNVSQLLARRAAARAS